MPGKRSKNWTSVKQFNLMFQTELGSFRRSLHRIYLRPETAQGIFVNYLKCAKNWKKKNSIWYSANWKGI